MPPDASSYDEVPYDTRPRPAAHPDRLATVATLLGMTPAPIDRCRVLELGCGTGGHLLPLADALPGSEFVGVDLSARQVETGRAVAAALGLANLRLEARSILDVGAELGPFDYVLCHGVYSWVPAEVRDGVLRACRAALPPQGVAYVSYNTYPGWYRRAGVADLLNFHTRGVGSPSGRTSEARAFLEFFRDALAGQDDTWARLVAEEAETLLAEDDYYLLHEHLDGVNHPVYFRDFVEHARRFGLQYLGEAASQLTLASYPPEVRRRLQAASADLVELEQYVDFLRCRSFRCTLLVGAGVTLDRSPRPEVLRKFLLSGAARPVAEGAADVAGRAVVAFRNEDGRSLETNQPLTKAALWTLYDLWPRAVPFAELFDQARRRLADAGVAVAERAADGLAAAVVELYLAGLVELHTHVPAFVTSPGERPRTTPLIAAQARSGAPVCNRRHRVVELSGVDRVVLGSLDGRLDRGGLLDRLASRVAADGVELRQHGEPVRDPARVRELLAAELEGSLGRLAGMALLVG